MKTPAEVLSEIKDAIRSHGYAWPGGNPLYIVMSDGEPLSVKAAKAHWKLVARETIARQGTWQAAGIDTNWEDPDLFCCHSNDRIESAYAED